MADQLKLHLRVLSPEREIYSADVASVSSRNSAGPFDILPMHANFITLIQNEPITVHVLNHERKIFNFPLAIIHVSHNEVRVFTEIGEAEKLLTETAMPVKSRREVPYPEK